MIMLRLNVTLMMAWMLTGCSTDSSDSSTSDADTDTDTDTDTDMDTDTDTDTDSDTDTDTDTDTDSGGDAAAVCARWNSDRADLDEGEWSGSVSACDPGDISETGRANALRVLNLYRFLADLPAVATDPQRNARAQACALMMTAEGNLSHSPSTDWACYSADGADAAGSSNISSSPGVASVDSYMIDAGNNTTLGHRRWILSNSLGPVGLGSSGSGASCMWTLQGSGNAGAEWTAWPSPGVFPIAANSNRWWSMDDTGWSIQSDNINLNNASVTVTANGNDLPVTVTGLASGYGSRYAISIIPDGWGMTADTTYEVSASGIDTPISYSFRAVNCD